MSRHIDKEALVAAVMSSTELDNEQKSQLIRLIREQKKYGLVWEDSTEDAWEKMKTSIPVLNEVDDKRILNDKDGEHYPNHAIIEADNLHALIALTYTHAGMIDVIYIDPPYNTGNKDFVYNDSFIGEDDAYRHSKWLSFMEKRLQIAKTLLSERGVIFISIDDNEQANLKLLCDEVFGEDKLVANIIWQKNYASKNNSQGIPAATEYLVTYSKSNFWTPHRLPRTEEMNSKYKNPDNDVAMWRSDNPCAPGAISHQGMVYAIQHPFTGELLYPYNGACWRYQQDDLLKIMNGWCDYELKDLGDDSKRAEVCGIREEEVRKGVKGIVLSKSIEDSCKQAESVLKRGQWPKFYFTKNGKGGIARKTYLSNVEGRLVNSFWPFTEVNHTDGAKKELKDLFSNTIPFDTPKPIDLLKRILIIASNQHSTILDFFAGSGTTLHATMLLNAEDGGHRQCILVTNNENNICEEVTYERNKRVIEGYTTPKGEQVAGLNHNNLRYYKLDFNPRKQSHQDNRELFYGLRNLLCIKENIYQEQQQFGSLPLEGKEQMLRYFAENGREMLMVYDTRVIPFIVNEIAQRGKQEQPLKIYIFADGAYPYTDDFASVIEKVSLIPMPYAYYRGIKDSLPEETTTKVDDTELTNEEQQAMMTEAIALESKE